MNKAQTRGDVVRPLGYQKMVRQSAASDGLRFCTLRSLLAPFWESNEPGRLTLRSVPEQLLIAFRCCVVFWLGCGVGLWVPSGLCQTMPSTSPLPTRLPDATRTEQITFGPQHHFYGYEGHAGNTPFNGDDTKLVLLETAFQDRAVTPGDAASIILYDLASKRSRVLMQTRAWNFQQGSMLYWNPRRPAQEFFFNARRDDGSDKIYTVLYDIDVGVAKRFFNPETPYANSGVAQGGGKFLAINYGRLARLRPVTGYAGAYDWTEGEAHPSNDGVWVVDVETGEDTLIVSYQRIYDTFVESYPDMEGQDLLVNHTLWNREDTRILASFRWLEDGKLRDIWVSFKPDGSDIREFKDPGHPDWETGTRLLAHVGGADRIYNVVTGEQSEPINAEFFLAFDGDKALYRDLNWIATHDKQNQDGRRQLSVLLYSRAAGAGLRFPPYPVGPYYYQGEQSVNSLNRIDMSPCWSRSGRMVYFYALAPDGTRQSFLIHLEWKESE